MGINMLMWTISYCDLHCPLCIVLPTQNRLVDYEMSMDEVQFFVDSSLERNIKYDLIIFTGGEPSFWKNLRAAGELMKSSGVTSEIGVITNGRHPDIMQELRDVITVYAVSSTQTTQDKVDQFKTFGRPLLINDGVHKVRPTSPLSNTLPTQCCNEYNFLGQPSTQLYYLNGKVHYCCYVPNAYINGVPIPEDLVCDFSDDFVTRFIGKRFDKEICSYCMCNSHVWEQL